MSTNGADANHLTLPLRSSADTVGSVRDVLARLESEGDDLEILRLLANSSVMFKPFVALSAAIMRRSTLPARTRELVVVRLASRAQSSYELAQHVRIGTVAGLTAAEIHDLCSDQPSLATCSSDERLAVALADELHERHRVSSSAWIAVKEAFGVEQLMDLLFVIGMYGGMVPLLMGGLGLEESDIGAVRAVSGDGGAGTK